MQIRIVSHTCGVLSNALRVYQLAKLSGSCSIYAVAMLCDVHDGHRTPGTLHNLSLEVSITCGHNVPPMLQRRGGGGREEESREGGGTTDRNGRPTGEHYREEIGHTPCRNGGPAGEHYRRK